MAFLFMLKFLFANVMIELRGDYDNFHECRYIRMVLTVLGLKEEPLVGKDLRSSLGKDDNKSTYSSS
ncbi:hypothetical protein PBAT_07935 [Paenibacillus antarcticus]|uniref:Uncharacterized protein n=1 Tax=Paenibacillus antarcticus TaxID=253703 RepID=A0A168PYL1_9BACL|nr:hypothetical protein PBAT_07935 [Paenibacillus antarcticus]